MEPEPAGGEILSCLLVIRPAKYFCLAPDLLASRLLSFNP